MPGLIVLPVDGKLHVCRLNGSDVTPLAVLPGAEDARCFPAYESGLVVVLDSRNKRAGLFALLDTEPWVDKVMPFATLPKACLGHTALALEGGLLVGGHSDTGEALWWRHPSQSPDLWQPVDLPKEIRQRGKAIDGLHRDGTRLIAVDDIVIPKWLLIYAISEGPRLTLTRKFELPSHTTYERIVTSFLAQDRLWCASRGINHGQASTHVWGLDLKRFKEQVCWSVSQRRVNAFAAKGQVESASPMEKAVGVAEWQDQLLVPCGSGGLLMTSLAGRSGVQEGADLRPIRGIELTTVTAVQAHPDTQASGIFALGTGRDGLAAYQWLPTELILT